MNQAGEATAAAPASLGIIRLALGLAQGIAAWLLLRLVPPLTYDATKPWWPQQHPQLFATLALLTAFVPVIALAEVGRMHRRRLGIYLAVSTAVLAALVAYDVWRAPIDGNWGRQTLRIWPSAGFVFCAGLAMFIVNQLMEHRERGHRLFTEYAAHFEDSWMRGFQFVISLVFTLLVWGVLELGKGLFDLIHLAWFGQMIEHNWFRCPVLAMSFAASVHITDVRPALLKGMRNLGLTLLSWLLPLVVGLGWAFLVALLFTGLQPLWNTRFAARLLLSAVTVALVLLNAAYKDGDPANLPALPVRWAGRAAGPMMLILSLLAAYAIAKRIGQYGWTPERVQSCAVAMVALIYGGGYNWASRQRGPWLRRLERVNVVASLAVLSILGCLLTPIADPARLAVNSQMGRLASGAVAPGKFDYQFLRFDAGRYGTDALAALTSNANAEIAKRARLAQASQNKIYGEEDADPASTEPPLSHVTVYPRGARLPADFTAGNLGQNVEFGPNCLRDGHPCDLILVDGITQGGPLLVARGHAAAGPGYDYAILSSLPVLGRNAAGKWDIVGHLQHGDCPGVLEALLRGEAAAVRPAQNDLSAGGVRLTFMAEAGSGEACPAPAPAAPPPSTGQPRAPAQMGPAFGHPGAM